MEETKTIKESNNWIVDELNCLQEKKQIKRNAVNINELNWKSLENSLAIDPRYIRRMKRDFSLLRSKSLRHQVFSICELIKNYEMLSKKFTWVITSLLLDISISETKSFYESFKKRDLSKNKGRPHVLRSDQLELIVEEIRRRQNCMKPMTKNDIREYIEREFKITISKRTITRIIKSDNRLCETTATPLEKERAEVTQIDLREFYDNLKKEISGYRPDCVINIDEIGFSRKIKNKNIKCVVTHDKKNHKIHYIQDDNNEKTFTLIAAVSIFGTNLKPYIVCPISSIPKEFLDENVCLGHDCVLDFNKSGFTTGTIICSWYIKVFREWVRSKRKKLNSPEEKIAIICDSFTGHNTNQFKELATEDNVKIIFLPPHSSHITQALDKYVFALVKEFYRNKMISCNAIIDKNCRKIYKILCSFESATNRFAIRKSWNDVGISPIWSNNQIGIEINGEKIWAHYKDMITDEKEIKKEPIKKRQKIKLDFIINSQELQWKNEGRCMRCGHIIYEEEDTGDIFHGGAIRLNAKNEEIQKESHIKQLEKLRKIEEIEQIIHDK